ncbi:hypothetical protein T261_8136 [Streptomyces lydicus]|nr:hypothetical protein T261_8136 [Streptomyces lydicus]
MVHEEPSAWGTYRGRPGRNEQPTSSRGTRGTGWTESPAATIVQTFENNTK